MKKPDFNNVFHDRVLGRAANLLIASVSAALLKTNVRPVSAKDKPIDLNAYNLVFADEFDGEELNTDLWSVHGGPGLRKGGYWSLDQVSLRDGNLIILTEYKKDGEFGSGWYTCGIDTHNTFMHKYGYYECRCILPKGQGLWSAFWLFNSSLHEANGTAVNGAELDVFESPFYFLRGDKSRCVTSNIHYNGYGLKTRYKNVVISKLDNNPYENYNTYGLLWTPEGYTFYVNGYEVGRSAYGGVSRKEEYMILSCEVDGAAAVPMYGWSGNIERNGREGFKAEFIVDYVRVYDKKQ